MGEFVLRESKGGGAARVAAEFRRARALSRLGAGPADNVVKRYLRAGLQRIRPAAASCFQNKGGHS